MILKEVKWDGKEKEDMYDYYEEIPDEELWEDGELNSNQVQHKIIHHTFQQGDWIMVRRIANE
jgi:hypothetical protein